MTEIYKVAIVGAGAIAKQHILCLKTIDPVEIVAVCDLSPAVAEATAERFSLPKWFTNFDEMLVKVKPDVVHITTPVNSHYHLAASSIEHGAHVFVEKPLATSKEQVHQLIAKSRIHNRVMIENYNYVYSKQMQEIIRLLRTNALGKIIHVDIYIRLNGITKDGMFIDPVLVNNYSNFGFGPIADFLPHLASILHCLVGKHNDVKTIWRRLEPEIAVYTEFKALVSTETASATLGFSAAAQPDYFGVEIYATKGQVSANLFEPRLTTFNGTTSIKPLLPLLNGIRERSAIKHGYKTGLIDKLRGKPVGYQGLWELIRKVYDSMERQTCMPVTTQQISEVTALIDDLTSKEALL